MVMYMKNKNIFWLLTVLLIKTLSACTEVSTLNEENLDGTSNPIFSPPPGGGGGCTGSGCGGGGGGDDDFTSSDPSYNFSISGPTGDKPKFSTLSKGDYFYTNSKLEAKFTAGAPSNFTIDGYENYSMLYSCLAVTINTRRYNPATGNFVGESYPKQTKLLAPSGGSVCKHPLSGIVYNSQSSEVINLDFLTGGGNPYPFVLEVKTARYNWRCEMFAMYHIYEFAMDCFSDAMKDVYWSHMVSGTLQVKVNTLQE